MAKFNYLIPWLGISKFYLKLYSYFLLLNLLIVDNNINTTSTNFAANFSNNFSLLNSSSVSASTSSYSTSYLNQTAPNSLEHSHSYFRNSQPNERNSLRFFTNSKFENNNNKNSFINNYVEKCDILKIKCKCIQILNRLVCLVSSKLKKKINWFIKGEILRRNNQKFGIFNFWKEILRL